MDLSGDMARASAATLGRVRAAEIGFVFQAFNLIPTLTAGENVDMGPEPAGVAKNERADRVADAAYRALARTIAGVADTRGGSRP